MLLEQIVTRTQPFETLVLLQVPVEVIDKIAGNDPLLWALAVGTFLTGMALVALFRLYYTQGEKHRSEYQELLKTTLTTLNALSNAMDYIGKELPRLSSDIRVELKDLSKRTDDIKERLR